MLRRIVCISAWKREPFPIGSGVSSSALVTCRLWRGSCRLRRGSFRSSATKSKHHLDWAPEQGLSLDQSRAGPSLQVLLVLARSCWSSRAIAAAHSSIACQSR